MEASEVQEFTKQLEEGGEKSLRYVSLVIAGLAVLLAIVTVLAHRAHTHSVLEQTRAADQWNEYQARRMRLQLLETENSLLSTQPSINEAAAKARIATNKAQITKWKAELDEDMKKARELETSVDHEERQAARFDLGEEMLQIAVVLSSITLLTRQQRYVLGALLLAAVGLVIAGTAFFLK